MVLEKIQGFIYLKLPSTMMSLLQDLCLHCLVLVFDHVYMSVLTCHTVSGGERATPPGVSGQLAAAGRRSAGSATCHTVCVSHRLED